MFTQGSGRASLRRWQTPSWREGGSRVRVWRVYHPRGGTCECKRAAPGLGFLLGEQQGGQRGWRGGSRGDLEVARARAPCSGAQRPQRTQEVTVHDGEPLGGSGAGGPKPPPRVDVFWGRKLLCGGHSSHSCLSPLAAETHSFPQSPLTQKSWFFSP